MPEDMALFGEEQGMAPQGGMPQGEIPQDSTMPLFEERGQNEFNKMAQNAPMFGGSEQEGFMESAGTEPIPYERLMTYIQQVLDATPELAEEVIGRIQQSGLSVADIENLGALSVISLANPEMYPSLVETMKAMFPETKETLTGDLEDDGPMLVNFVIAAFVNEGGII